MPMPSGDPTAGSPSVAEGGASAVSYCDALKVVQDKCQRCHSMPPQNGAPIPFITWEDFQEPYGNSGETYGQYAVGLVERGAMPFVVLNDPPTNLMPPVEPLTDDEKATLLAWLRQGAQPLGGTDCP